MAHGDVARTTDHWWWRPGWGPGTRYYTWHVTLEGQDRLHARVAELQSALAGLPALAPVPRRWLHVTVAGLGDVGDVPAQVRDDVVVAVRRRAAAVPAFRADVLGPVVGREAVVLPLRPLDRFDAVRDAVRAGIADAWGRSRVVGPDRGFAPHLSVAYASGEADAAPVRAALDGVPASREPLVVDRVQLIELERDDRAYRWRTVAEVPLGDGDTPAAEP
ncbi:2'-5' RNA ligase family protein [Actinotalea sp. AC32]|nr:2'-5' RNA ligase family protein [Actinotalea sp. AC32]